MYYFDKCQTQASISYYVFLGFQFPCNLLYEAVEDLFLSGHPYLEKYQENPFCKNKPFHRVMDRLKIFPSTGMTRPKEHKDRGISLYD